MLITNLGGWTPTGRRRPSCDAETLKDRTSVKTPPGPRTCPRTDAHSGGWGDGGPAAGGPARSAGVLPERRRPCCCPSTRLRHRGTVRSGPSPLKGRPGSPGWRGLTVERRLTLAVGRGRLLRRLAAGLLTRGEGWSQGWRGRSLRGRHLSVDAPPQHGDWRRTGSHIQVNTHTHTRRVCADLWE